MTRDTPPHTLPVPSRASLARATAVALLTAGAILIAVVLPAEYGVDPTGIGGRLGLTRIAARDAAAVDLPRIEGAPLAPVESGPVGAYPREYQYDVYEIALAPYEYVEYKYQLEKGATMLYSWTATAAVVHDLHAERLGDAGGGPAEESFDKSDRRQSTGSYTAPFTGIHGWYWENPGVDPIRIRLTTAGFYSAAIEIRSDRTRHARTLRQLDSLPAAPGAAPAAGTR